MSHIIDVELDGFIWVLVNQQHHFSSTYCHVQCSLHALHVLLMIAHSKEIIIWVSISVCCWEQKNVLLVTHIYSVHPHSLWLKTFYIALCKTTFFEKKKLLFYWVHIYCAWSKRLLLFQIKINSTLIQA